MLTGCVILKIDEDGMELLGVEEVKSFGCSLE